MEVRHLDLLALDHHPIVATGVQFVLRGGQGTRGLNLFVSKILGLFLTVVAILLIVFEMR